MLNLKDDNSNTTQKEGNLNKNNFHSVNEVKKNTVPPESQGLAQIDCLFCDGTFQKTKNYTFAEMINRALYSKYSSSQNYYYTKDINEILAESRTAAVILFKDFLHIDEEEEYLKRFYFYKEYDFKIKMLTEYYKFHNDIARIFITPVIHTVNRYHDKKRRLEYNRVTKMLKEEQEIQSPELKPEEKKETKDYVLTDRVLDDLDLTNSEQKNDQKSPSPGQSTQNYFSNTSSKNKTISKRISKDINKIGTQNLFNKILETNKEEAINQTREISISNTINDLNAKLGEIIANSRSHNLDMNYFESTEAQPNDTISNLSKFLLYLNKNSLNEEGQKQNDRVSLNTQVLNSVPLTDRPYRPQLPKKIVKTRQPSRGDSASRGSDSLVKVASPNTTKPTIRLLKSPERIKPREDEKASIVPSKSSTSNQVSKPRTEIVAKIKNFEEALKINNIQNSQQKTSAQASLLKEDKVTPASTLKSVNRTNQSRTPRKKLEEKSYESSLIAKQKSQTYSSNTSRPTSRTKTRSNDMYTKALDMLLGGNQILIGNSGSKIEITTQTHRSTKSSFNFKVKTPNQPMFNQNEKRFGKEDLKIDSGLMTSSNKTLSNKLASERLYLQTEREIKKMGSLGSGDTQMKNNKQPPLTERQLQREYLQKEDANKGLRASAFASNDFEIARSYLNSQNDQRKIGFHKYTKSEGRMKKPEFTEKIEIVNDVKSLMNGSGRTRVIGGSPRRPTYIHNQNNIVNVFISPNTERKAERNLTLKSEKQPYQEGGYYGEKDTGIKILTTTKSPDSELLSRFNQTFTKKFSLNNDNDYKNFDFSPLRSKHKESSITQQMRVLSDKSSPNYPGSVKRAKGKIQFEAIRKDLRFDNFEIYNRSKEK